MTVVAAERAEAVAGLLGESGALPAGGRVVSVEQIEGGWSRASYVATTDGGAEYIVRAKPPGGLLDTDLMAEYRLYAALQGAGIPIPAVHGLDAGGDTPFKGPFFVMDKMPGRAPNVFRARDRRALQEDWDGPRTIAEEVVTHLARIHTVTLGESEAFLPRLSYRAVVGHWESVYEDVRLVRDPVLEEAMAWLRAREPADEQLGLVHADYRPGNMLVDGGRVSAILDWELAYLGDVRFDLGYLALDRIAGQHLEPVGPLLGGVAEADWFFAEYERRTGRPVDRDTVDTFSVLGAVMLAAIMLTGVRAYAEGCTTDVRMAWNHYSLPGLREQAARLMRW